MKAAAFDYIRPDTLGAAITLLTKHGPDAKLIAGGQSLLPALNLRLSAPGLLIDIGRLAELRGITLADRTLHIGAGCTHAQVMNHPMVQRHAPLIARALAAVAHPAIRARGTFGGSLANADPAAELPACALALDAVMQAQGPAGPRRIPAAHFFTSLFETALAPDEVLTGVDIPIQGDTQWGFAELARRTGDYAMVGLAAVARPGTIRLGWFSVGQTAILAHRAAAILTEGGPLEAACTALADDLPAHDDPQASAAMRLHLARVLLRRVVGAWGGR
ncbi:MAG: molybdopterin dehydrogenase [Acidiphilium sp. 37-64-53]|uniref:FAD binding domain-containing protein n=1 Tax=Acidiphilium TaxID=522 RepID=UPI000BD68044|nr:MULTISPECIES: FAD binding domain-containing protein [Acidiphilium]OYW00664.1 MAG: molybdopterin dehydrogenase [Acidiphilium sp. 37-64-53]OZB24956.1 MAG: molybdopterin dehydrogenase [Acidiphilium sp. 34-64-41]HQT85889.1 FAD binding domain-containing protein [Acidiphilium rubrum]